MNINEKPIKDTGSIILYKTYNIGQVYLWNKFQSLNVIITNKDRFMNPYRKV